MTAYVESVEDPEQDTVLSLLAYHSWGSGHQVTLHRPQDGSHQWSPEQTAKWDIVLQLTPKGFCILTSSGLPDATTNAQALPLAQPREDDADAPPPEECNSGPPHSHHRTHAAPAHQTSPPPQLPCHQRLAGTPHTAPAVGITRRLLHVGGNPPQHRGAHVPVAPAAETHTQPPGTHLLLTLEGEAAVGNVHTVWLHAHGHTTPPTVVPGVTPLARGHRATAHRGRYRKRLTGMGGQVGTRVRLPARGVAQTLPHQSHPRAGPHHGRIPHQGRPPPQESGPTCAPSTARQRKPSRPPSPTTRASCTPPRVTRKRATPHGGTTPHQKGACSHLQTNLASARTSQRSPTPSPPWPSKLGHRPNRHRPSSEKRRHTTTQLSHTAGDAPFIPPYRTSTSLPTMRGPSTSS